MNGRRTQTVPRVSKYVKSYLVMYLITYNCVWVFRATVTNTPTVMLQTPADYGVSVGVRKIFRVRVFVRSLTQKRMILVFKLGIGNYIGRF